MERITRDIDVYGWGDLDWYRYHDTGWQQAELTLGAEEQFHTGTLWRGHTISGPRQLLFRRPPSHGTYEMFELHPVKFDTYKDE